MALSDEEDFDLDNLDEPDAKRVKLEVPEGDGARKNGGAEGEEEQKKKLEAEIAHLEAVLAEAQKEVKAIKLIMKAPKMYEQLRKTWYFNEGAKLRYDKENANYLFA